MNAHAYVADRGIGKVFFKDYYLMDAELLGGGARKVIEHEAQRRGMTPLLPPQAPFYSNDWPWRTDPTKGKGPSTLEEALNGCPRHLEASSSVAL